DVPGMLPPDGLVYVQGCSGESRLIADAVMKAGEALGPITFTGIFVPGLNRCTYVANAACRTRTFFMTPELRAAEGQVDFLPLCYQDVRAHLGAAPIGAALFQVAPPDANGLCSFGPVADFLPDLWERIPLRIAHVNPSLPRTSGPAIPVEALAAVIEQEEALAGSDEGAGDAVAALIADHIAHLVPENATLQTGLGKIPGAGLRALRDRRGLRIHSGLIGDAVLDLLEAGALAAENPITAGVAIGSERLYSAIANPAFAFRPVSYTHDPRVIARLPNFVAINSAIEVDLYGQAHAELTRRGLLSGPGGASDFARGARLGGGLRIVALPASAGDGSRIVPAGEGIGPVSLGRMDVDIVVTEHGAADLRGLDLDLRAEALIGIAAEDQREALARSWSERRRLH
ncbi:MAG: hypothetical protein JWN69_709, partial [Alphaproteobacteria bacterium]|nr:hypothetical protein [Alphaproteobacteria bacterium]